MQQGLICILLSYCLCLPPQSLAAEKRTVASAPADFASVPDQTTGRAQMIETFSKLNWLVAAALGEHRPAAYLLNPLSYQHYIHPYRTCTDGMRVPMGELLGAMEEVSTAVYQYAERHKASILSTPYTNIDSQKSPRDMVLTLPDHKRLCTPRPEMDGASDLNEQLGAYALEQVPSEQQMLGSLSMTDTPSMTEFALYVSWYRELAALALRLSYLSGTVTELPKLRIVPELAQAYHQYLDAKLIDTPFRNLAEWDKAQLPRFVPCEGGWCLSGTQDGLGEPELARLGLLKKDATDTDRLRSHASMALQLMLTNKALAERTAGISGGSLPPQCKADGSGFDLEGIYKSQQDQYRMLETLNVFRTRLDKLITDIRLGKLLPPMAQSGALTYELGFLQSLRIFTYAAQEALNRTPQYEEESQLENFFKQTSRVYPFEAYMLSPLAHPRPLNVRDREFFQILSEKMTAAFLTVSSSLKGHPEGVEKALRPIVETAVISAHTEAVMSYVAHLVLAAPVSETFKLMVLDIAENHYKTEVQAELGDNLKDVRNELAPMIAFLDKELFSSAPVAPSLEDQARANATRNIEQVSQDLDTLYRADVTMDHMQRLSEWKHSIAGNLLPYFSYGSQASVADSYLDLDDGKGFGYGGTALSNEAPYSADVYQSFSKILVHSNETDGILIRAKDPLARRLRERGLTDREVERRYLQVLPGGKSIAGVRSVDQLAGMVTADLINLASARDIPEEPQARADNLRASLVPITDGTQASKLKKSYERRISQLAYTWYQETVEPLVAMAGEHPDEVIRAQLAREMDRLSKEWIFFREIDPDAIYQIAKGAKADTKALVEAFDKELSGPSLLEGVTPDLIDDYSPDNGEVSEKLWQQISANAAGYKATSSLLGYPEIWLVLRKRVLEKNLTVRVSRALRYYPGKTLIPEGDNEAERKRLEMSVTAPLANLVFLKAAQQNLDSKTISERKSDITALFIRTVNQVKESSKPDDTELAQKIVAALVAAYSNPSFQAVYLADLERLRENLRKPLTKAMLPTLIPLLRYDYLQSYAPYAEDVRGLNRALTKPTIQKFADQLFPSFERLLTELRAKATILSSPTEDVDYELEKWNQLKKQIALAEKDQNPKATTKEDSQSLSKLKTQLSMVDAKIALYRRHQLAAVMLTKALETYFPKEQNPWVAGIEKALAKGASEGKVWTAYFEDQFLNSKVDRDHVPMALSMKLVLQDLAKLEESVAAKTPVKLTGARLFLHETDQYCKAWEKDPESRKVFSRDYQQTIVNLVRDIDPGSERRAAALARLVALQDGAPTGGNTIKSALTKLYGDQWSTQKAPSKELSDEEIWEAMADAVPEAQEYCAIAGTALNELPSSKDRDYLTGQTLDRYWSKARALTAIFGFEGSAMRPFVTAGRVFAVDHAPANVRLLITDNIAAADQGRFLAMTGSKHRSDQTTASEAMRSLFLRDGALYFLDELSKAEVWPEGVASVPMPLAPPLPDAGPETIDQVVLCLQWWNALQLADQRQAFRAVQAAFLAHAFGNGATSPQVSQRLLELFPANQIEPYMEIGPWLSRLSDLLSKWDTLEKLGAQYRESASILADTGQLALAAAIFNHVTAYTDYRLTSNDDVASLLLPSVVGTFKIDNTKTPEESAQAFSNLPPNGRIQIVREIAGLFQNELARVSRKNQMNSLGQLADASILRQKPETILGQKALITAMDLGQETAFRFYPASDHEPAYKARPYTNLISPEVSSLEFFLANLTLSADMMEQKSSAEMFAMLRDGLAAGSDQRPIGNRPGRRLELSWENSSEALANLGRFRSTVEQIAMSPRINDQWQALAETAGIRPHIWSLAPSMEAFLNSKLYKQIEGLLKLAHENARAPREPDTYQYLLAKLSYRTHRGHVEQGSLTPMLQAGGGLLFSERAGYLDDLAELVGFDLKDFSSWKNLLQQTTPEDHHALAREYRFIKAEVGNRKLLGTLIEAPKTRSGHSYRPFPILSDADVDLSFDYDSFDHMWALAEKPENRWKFTRASDLRAAHSFEIAPVERWSVFEDMMRIRNAPVDSRTIWTDREGSLDELLGRLENQGFTISKSELAGLVQIRDRFAEFRGALMDAYAGHDVDAGALAKRSDELLSQFYGQMRALGYQGNPPSSLAMGPIDRLTSLGKTKWVTTKALYMASLMVRDLLYGEQMNHHQVATRKRLLTAVHYHLEAQGQAESYLQGARQVSSNIDADLDRLCGKLPLILDESKPLQERHEAIAEAGLHLMDQITQNAELYDSSGELADLMARVSKEQQERVAWIDRTMLGFQWVLLAGASAFLATRMFPAVSSLVPALTEIPMLSLVASTGSVAMGGLFGYHVYHMYQEDYGHRKDELIKLREILQSGVDGDGLVTNSAINDINISAAYTLYNHSLPGAASHAFRLWIAGISLHMMLPIFSQVIRFGWAGAMGRINYPRWISRRISKVEKGYFGGKLDIKQNPAAITDELLSERASEQLMTVLRDADVVGNRILLSEHDARLLRSVMGKIAAKSGTPTGWGRALLSRRSMGERLSSMTARIRELDKAMDRVLMALQSETPSITVDELFQVLRYSGTQAIGRDVPFWFQLTGFGKFWQGKDFKLMSQVEKIAASREMAKQAIAEYRLMSAVRENYIAIGEIAEEAGASSRAEFLEALFERDHRLIDLHGRIINLRQKKPFEGMEGVSQSGQQAAFESTGPDKVLRVTNELVDAHNFFGKPAHELPSSYFEALADGNFNRAFRILRSHRVIATEAEPLGSETLDEQPLADDSIPEGGASPDGVEGPSSMFSRAPGERRMARVESENYDLKSSLAPYKNQSEAYLNKGKPQEMVRLAKLRKPHEAMSESEKIAWEIIDNNMMMPEKIIEAAQHLRDARPELLTEVVEQGFRQAYLIKRVDHLGMRLNPPSGFTKEEFESWYRFCDELYSYSMELNGGRFNLGHFDNTLTALSDTAFAPILAEDVEIDLPKLIDLIRTVAPDKYRDQMVEQVEVIQSLLAKPQLSPEVNPRIETLLSDYDLQPSLAPYKNQSEAYLNIGKPQEMVRLAKLRKPHEAMSESEKIAWEIIDSDMMMPEKIIEAAQHLRDARPELRTEVVEQGFRQAYLIKRIDHLGMRLNPSSGFTKEEFESWYRFCDELYSYSMELNGGQFNVGHFDNTLSALSDKAFDPRLAADVELNLPKLIDLIHSFPPGKYQNQMVERVEVIQSLLAKPRLSPEVDARIETLLGELHKDTDGSKVAEAVGEKLMSPTTKRSDEFIDGLKYVRKFANGKYIRGELSESELRAIDEISILLRAEHQVHLARFQNPQLTEETAGQLRDELISLWKSVAERNPGSGVAMDGDEMSAFLREVYENLNLGKDLELNVLEEALNDPYYTSELTQDLLKRTNEIYRHYKPAPSSEAQYRIPWTRGTDELPLPKVLTEDKEFTSIYNALTGSKGESPLSDQFIGLLEQFKNRGAGSRYPTLTAGDQILSSSGFSRDAAPRIRAILKKGLNSQELSMLRARMDSYHAPQFIIEETETALQITRAVEIAKGHTEEALWHHDLLAQAREVLLIEQRDLVRSTRPQLEGKLYNQQVEQGFELEFDRFVRSLESLRRTNFEYKSPGQFRELLMEASLRGEPKAWEKSLVQLERFVSSTSDVGESAIFRNQALQKLAKVGELLRNDLSHSSAFADEIQQAITRLPKELASEVEQAAFGEGSSYYQLDQLRAIQSRIARGTGHKLVKGEDGSMEFVASQYEDATLRAMEEVLHVYQRYHLTKSYRIHRGASEAQVAEVNQSLQKAWQDNQGKHSFGDREQAWQAVDDLYSHLGKTPPKRDLPQVRTDLEELIAELRTWQAAKQPHLGSEASPEELEAAQKALEETTKALSSKPDGQLKAIVDKFRTAGEAQPSIPGSLGALAKTARKSPEAMEVFLQEIGVNETLVERAVAATQYIEISTGYSPRLHMDAAYFKPKLEFELPFQVVTDSRTLAHKDFIDFYLHGEDTIGADYLSRAFSDGVSEKETRLLGRLLERDHIKAARSRKAQMIREMKSRDPRIATRENDLKLEDVRLDRRQVFYEIARTDTEDPRFLELIQRGLSPEEAGLRLYRTTPKEALEDKLAIYERTFRMLGDEKGLARISQLRQRLNLKGPAAWDANQGPNSLDAELRKALLQDREALQQFREEGPTAPNPEQ